MMKFISAAFIFAVSTFHCIAQSDLSSTKKFNHYVGIQANELLRQLFNFSSTNTTITNPYTVIYSLSPTNSKWGAHAGLGYIYSWIDDKSDEFGRVTKVSNIQYRVGIEKKIMLGKRFEAGIAFDFVGASAYDKTTSLNVTNLFNSIDSSFVTVVSKATTLGAGPQFSISYGISEKIFLGTETTLYYVSNNQKDNISVTDKVTQLFNGSQEISYSNTNTEVKTNKFAITLPVALFLIVKF